MSNGVPSTTFSGKSSPNGPSNSDTMLFKGLMLLVFVILAPVAAIVAFTVYMLFQFARIPWQTFLLVTAIYTGLLGLWILTFDQQPLQTYALAWQEGQPVFADGGIDAVMVELQNRWVYWLAATVPLGVWLGLVVGTGTAAWRWVRRPQWETYRMRRTPWEVLRARKAEKEILENINPPNDGTTVGVDEEEGRKVVQTDAEAVMHTLLVGTTGCGKSTAELMSLRDAVRRGLGIVVVDLKGAPDLPETLAAWADEYGREFQHFTFHNIRGGRPYEGPAKKGPAFYDPAGRGDPSRRKDLLVGSQKWTEEYYKNVVENYLQLAFIADDLIKPFDNRPTLDRVAELLVPEHLQTLALSGDEKWRAVFRAQEFREAIMRVTTGLEPGEKSAIRSMYSRLQVLRASIAGDYLRSDPFGTDNTIDLYKTAEEGRIVVFSLDASNYQETARQIAGLIVQDLKTLSSELRARPVGKLMHVFIDEFAEIGSDNVIGLMNKCRDSGMPVTISTQSLHDLARVEPTFIGQVLDVANTFKIMRANTEESARVFAGLTGMVKKYQKKYEFEMNTTGGMIGVGASTGGGSVSEVDDYRVPPQVFQNLNRGEMVYITKSPEFKVRELVRVVAVKPEPVRERFSTMPRSLTPGGDNVSPPESDVPDLDRLRAEAEEYVGVNPDTDAPWRMPSAPSTPSVPDIPEVGVSFDTPARKPQPTAPAPAAPRQPMATQPPSVHDDGWGTSDSVQARPVPVMPALPVPPSAQPTAPAPAERTAPTPPRPPVPPQGRQAPPGVAPMYRPPQGIQRPGPRPTPPPAQRPAQPGQRPPAQPSLPTNPGPPRPPGGQQPRNAPPGPRTPQPPAAPPPTNDLPDVGEEW